MPLPAGWRDIPRAATRRLRLFAGPADEPRARRPSDAVLLVTSVVALWLLAWAAVPPTRTERAIIAVLASLPGFLDGLWQLTGFNLGWRGMKGRGRALGVGEVKFTGMVTPKVRLVEYTVEFTRVIDRKLKLGIANGTMRADGEAIYTATDMKVGLFKD